MLLAGFETMPNSGISEQLSQETESRLLYQLFHYIHASIFIYITYIYANKMNLFKTIMNPNIPKLLNSNGKNKATTTDLLPVSKPPSFHQKITVTPPSYDIHFW